MMKETKNKVVKNVQENTENIKQERNTIKRIVKVIKDTEWTTKKIVIVLAIAIAVVVVCAVVPAPILLEVLIVIKQTLNLLLLIGVV